MIIFKDGFSQSSDSQIGMSEVSTLIDIFNNSVTKIDIKQANTY